MQDRPEQSAHPVAGGDATAAGGVSGVRWACGEPGEPPLQVHHFDDATVILRQSKRLHFEGPFLFLLFGTERALLLDTGATADPELFPLRAVVDDLVTRWLERHPREGYELVVAHTHAHGDHVAGDGQFEGRPATVVVGHVPEAVHQFFGLGPVEAQGVTEPASFDLGGRVLRVLATPGHHPSSVTVFDEATGLLLTGDTVLPGRLYVSDRAAFLATLDHLVGFAARHPVTHVFGCHVEMGSAPGEEFPIGARFQPGERAPQMTPEQLTAVRDAARSVAGRRGVHRFDDFVIHNEARRRDTFRLLARGLAHRATAWVRRRPA